MGTIKVSASILAADYAKLGEESRRAEKAGADMIHVDIMDGSFVPTITIGPQMVKALRQHTVLPLDVHLMIVNPERHIDEFAKSGADMITVHAEACLHLHRTLQAIREAGMKAGVALNPATPLSALDYILDDIDLVLLMSVNPGYGGQSFIPAILGKIAQMRKLIDEGEKKTDISVDGGISATNAQKIISAGASVLSVGTAVFGAVDMKRAILQLKGEPK